MEALANDGVEICEELRHPGAANLIVSIIILVGMLISYLPQHVRIIARRTSEGISPYYILLGTTSATSAFANVILLPQSRHDVACCAQLETLQCLAGLLGIGQLGVQWFCVVFIFVLFLVFFRYNTSVVPAEELGGEAPGFPEVLFVSSLIILHGLAVLVVTAVIGAVANQYLSLWANILGLMAAALAAVQYIPQIWTTYRLKHIGSLSIPMMLIQTPGGLLFTASLFARYGWAGWSSWGIFLLTATMQGVLLVMAISYEIQAHRDALDDSDDTAVSDNDDAPSFAPQAQGQAPHPHLYSNGFDDDRPTTYTSHPEVYATDQEDLSRIVDRQESDAAAERQPLLKPGGIGDSHKKYDPNLG